MQNSLNKLGREIDRFSYLSKYWSSINMITLSTFLVGLSFLVEYLNSSFIKYLVLVIYLISIILTNIMAINYLALEKSAREREKIIIKQSESGANIDSSKRLELKPYIWKACKSWSVYLPFCIYLSYFVFLLILTFY